MNIIYALLFIIIYGIIVVTFLYFLTKFFIFAYKPSKEIYTQISEMNPGELKTIRSKFSKINSYIFINCIFVTIIFYLLSSLIEPKTSTTILVNIFLSISFGGTIFYLIQLILPKFYKVNKDEWYIFTCISNSMSILPGKFLIVSDTFKTFLSALISFILIIIVRIILN